MYELINFINSIFFLYFRYYKKMQYANFVESLELAFKPAENPDIPPFSQFVAQMESSFTSLMLQMARKMTRKMARISKQQEEENQRKRKRCDEFDNNIFVNNDNIDNNGNFDKTLLFRAIAWVHQVEVPPQYEFYDTFSNVAFLKLVLKGSIGIKPSQFEMVFFLRKEKYNRSGWKSYFSNG